MSKLEAATKHIGIISENIKELEGIKNKIRLELIETQQMDDREEAHMIADYLVCELLEFFNCNDVVNEYNKIGKWYS